MNKTTVELRNPTIRLMVLAHLAQEFEDFDPHRLEEYQSAGFDPMTIDRFRGLKIADLVRLAHVSRKESVCIHVNASSLVADMNRYEHMRADSEAYEYFVRYGASTSLLMDLFSKRPSDIKRMQMMMGVTTQAGRKALPDDESRIAITEVWHRMRTGFTWPYMAREHIIEIHKAYPHLSIAQLEAVLATYKTQSGSDSKSASGASPS
jgi:hypothetical protein